MLYLFIKNRAFYVIKHVFCLNICIFDIIVVLLHRVFHGIRFKVNEDWVVVRQSFFFLYHFFLALFVILNAHENALAC